MTLKQTSLLLFAFMLMASFCVLAGPAVARDGGGFATSNSQGFQGPGPRIITVKEALSMSDDTKVALRGNIIQHLGGDDYAFQDATGTITVDIDDKRWGGQTITPQDTVEITGKVDRDWGHVEIEVKSVNKVQ